MSVRGARLAAVAAVLATLAAAPAAFPSLLPEGLALDFAPLYCGKEIAAGLILWALVLVPASVAADGTRGREDHGALLSLLAGAPVVTALVLAAGGDGSALLPLAVMAVLVDLAASSYLRLDGGGRWSPAWVGACLFLGFGVPLLGWAFDDLGGWKGAWEWRRFSPMFAARSALAPGQGDPWGAVLPAGGILLAMAAVLRLASIPRHRPPKTVGVAAAVALLLLLPATARAGDVLVIGSPRDGPAAEVVRALRTADTPMTEVPDLPGVLPPGVCGVLLARLPAPGEEETLWRATLGEFLVSGGVVGVLSGQASLLPGVASGEGDGLGRVVILDGGVSVESAAESLRQPRTALLHPSQIHPDGLVPDLHRIPFARGPAPLPVRTFAYLGVVACVLALAWILAPSGDAGTLRRLRPAGLALVAVALLFLPGLAGEELLIRRLVLEERSGPTATAARRITLIEAERVRPGGATIEVSVERARWAGIPWESGVPAGVEASSTALRFDIPEPGHRAMAAGLSGVALKSDGARFHWSWIVHGEYAWPEPDGTASDAPANRSGEGESWSRVLEDLRRSPDPTVSRPAAALRALFRAPPGGGTFRVGAMAGGADAVVLGGL